MSAKKNFPDWDSFYKETDVKEMPWYEQNLDADLADQINSMNLKEGKFLDLGTGPGTQAIELAKLGFESIGADISKHAISKAQELSSAATFLVDDILNSSFADDEFDFILDRGCFHVFEPSLREKYLNQIKRILRYDGILFLKVMSKEEKTLPGEEGPYKFSEQDVLDAFEKDFQILSIKPTVYYGTMNPPPKAIFATIKQKS
ncbi:class I SAM-dependent methyltransferase [Nitrosopumilus sp.]|uniref:class I SAM-dependent methyltransferase n=1 Tax=Nitrosopumilus sp. TaxID=2024843 RepID=UPI00247E2ECB|nr:class I SAM-dependent methyltransferase [Nitrosopumilus sp.]MCV0430662.1 class I SAM-dependent methyltransferase [Nitrosopumilus sp.]